MITGDSVRKNFSYPTELGVRRAGGNRFAASPRRQGSESECIGVWILYQTMNAVMYEVPYAERSVGAEALLPFQAPSLVLAPMWPVSVLLTA